jgi:pyridoxine 4-dehydrogenase
LASNQIQYSLLSRQADNNGLKRAAQELNVTLLAYSPLAQGLLTGKYDVTNLPRGPRSAVVRANLPRVKGLLDTLKEIALSKSESQNIDVSMSQVALNWCISKGTVPIPGARSLKQAVDNCATLKWTLDAADVKLLDDKATASGVNIPAPLEGR